MVNRKEAKQILEKFRNAAKTIIMEIRFKKLIKNPFGVNNEDSENTKNRKGRGVKTKEGKETSEFLDLFRKF